MRNSMVASKVLQKVKHRCSTSVICGTIFCIIVSRIVGLSLHTVWICDCFFREFKIGNQCKNFSLYPNAEVYSVVWLTIVSFTSLLLIFHVSRLPEFPSFKSIISHLLRKKYFYKLCVILILVLIYDLISILGGEMRGKITIVYTAFMVEHITSIALMFTLNFVPKFVKNTSSLFALKTAVYKMILLVYSIENYVIYGLGTIVAAYKLVAIPTCMTKQLEINRYNISLMPASRSDVGNTVCHDATSVAMLLLLLVARSLRHTLGEFFLTKIFRENADNLDSPSQPNTLQELMDISEEESPENTRLLIQR